MDEPIFEPADAETVIRAEARARELGIEIPTESVEQ
jgi:hypothetical protein